MQTNASKEEVRPRRNLRHLLRGAVERAQSHVQRKTETEFQVAEKQARFLQFHAEIGRR
jgi:hypothetical protein